MTTATTIGGWVALLAVGGAYYYVTQTSNKKAPTIASKQSVKTVEPRKDTKTKKGRGGSGDDKKAVKKPTQAVKEDKISNAAPVSFKDDKDEIDNREFARQLTQAKSGSIQTPKSQLESRPKSIKQTKAQEKKKNVETSSDNATAPSSTTGGDADDDQSPINSPELGATAVSGDVSDMLEKSTSGPSVLRVTEPTKPVQVKKAKAAPVETAETKKQRQNKKKADEKKAAREEEEKVRQALLEKQRRTAREAEGRAAKDGSVFMASKAPTSSAWTAPSTTNGNSTASKSTQLLDTYEPTSVKPVERQVHGNKLDSVAALSEEEQYAIAVDASQNWETVKKADKRKSKKENVPLSNDKQSSASENDFQPPPLIAPTGPGKQWETNLVHVDDNGNVHESNVVLQDSEWEVA